MAGVHRERKCMKCGVKIEQNDNGGALWARDILFILRDEVGPPIVREICGRCAVRWDLGLEVVVEVVYA